MLIKNREKESTADVGRLSNQIIGHIKKDHRAALNYLKGKAGDQVNFAMAASGFNYRKLMKKLRAIALWLYTKLVSNRKSQLKLKSFTQFDLISPPKMSF